MDVEYSDEDLFVLMSFKKEDEEGAKDAFRVFYDRYKKLVWTLCFRTCASLDAENGKELADCVFNNTMMAIYEHPTYDSRKAKLSTWISRIARNEASDLFKEYGITDNRVTPLNEAITTPIFDENEKAVEYEVPSRKVLDAALALLSERDREILMTYFMYQDGNKHLPDDVLGELERRYSTTSSNIRQIKKRSLDKVKTYMLQQYSFAVDNKK
jgi:RNA polymerase sigma factor (sigma-70 family)